MPLAGKQAPLLIILGPTAIGKTGLAIDIAQQLNGEIIGADSRQIYRYMDIGTAKPSMEQRQMAVHHLVDFHEPDADFTLAEYQEMAYNAIDKVLAQRKLPMLVGGTGQYITAVEEGWSIPHVPPNYELRAALETEAQAIGNEDFHAKLLAVDPEAAKNIHPNNLRRVVRALEVYLETGTPISVLQRKKPPPYRIRVIGLKMERETLYEQADLRVDLMMHDGFLEEVRRLLDKGYRRGLPSMSALGYRELAAHLLDDLPLNEALQLIKFSTHDFIRRQEVWFRGHDNGILWHNINELDVSQLIIEIADWVQE
jgi:tRNA dimethylallyltransferase